MTPHDERDPVVVLASDDRYAMPLAVALRSALDHLDPARRLRVYLLDTGLRRRSRRLLLRSWDSARLLDLTWLRVDASRFGRMGALPWQTATCFVRLLIPELLPESVSRAIWLDADLVVQGDLGRLWDEPLRGRPALAVRDTGAPFIDSELALGPACAALVTNPRPITNYQELGLSPHASYVNTGVMLMDLEAWRREGLTRTLLACIESHRDRLWAGDQYALNAVLCQRWGELDLRWNLAPSADRYRGIPDAPFEPDALRRALADPWIVHFVGAEKPWVLGRAVPYGDLFHRHRARTAWAGWRGWPRMAKSRLEAEAALTRRRAWATVRPFERRARRARRSLRRGGRRLRRVAARARRLAGKPPP